MNLGDLVQFYGSQNGQTPRQQNHKNPPKNRQQYQVPQPYAQQYPAYVPHTPVLGYTPQPPAPSMPMPHYPNFVPPPPPMPVQYLPPVYSKRPKPPKPVTEDEGEGEYSCDACEKCFKTTQQHEAHLKSHVKCTYPGCTFHAAYSIVKLHKMRHLNASIGKTETPEEVNRYIDERKKRFPTQDVVAKKAEEEQKRRDRGEIVDKNSRFNRKNSRSNTNNKRNNRTQFKHDAPQEKHVEQPISSEALHGTSEPADQPEELKTVKPDAVPMHERAADSEGEVRADAGLKRKRSCKYFMQGRCLKGAQCTFAHEEMGPRKRPRQMHDSNKSKSSLLEKARLTKYGNNQNSNLSPVVA